MVTIVPPTITFADAVIVPGMLPSTCTLYVPVTGSRAANCCGLSVTIWRWRIVPSGRNTVRIREPTPDRAGSA